MRFLTFLTVLLIAVALTYLFWAPLWHGGGLVGGDTYSYYFPQKTFFADRLQDGEFPLWNPLVGHGYPLVAESQTGALYWINPPLFRLFSVNTAYNIAQLTHYVLAFLATWLLARRMGLGHAAAIFTGVIFIYAWFPPRICLEWSIIGGVYFPLAVLLTESFLVEGRRTKLVVLALVLGLFLTAGHYNLAFITVITVAAYAACRLLFRGAGLDEDVRRRSAASFVFVCAAMFAGFAVAAAQLAPTWELKQSSQRTGEHQHDPAYGNIPPWYLSQVVAPWMWYAPEVNADRSLHNTNKVEAHLYFGMLPLVLAVGGVVFRMWRGSGTPAWLKIWAGLGIAATVYATGCLLPISRHLPGFSYFIGPGRYGIVTTMAVALLAGYSLDRWSAHCRTRFGRAALIAIALGLALADLWIVRCHWNRTAAGEPAWYADLLEHPPIEDREASPVREALADFGRPVRMWAPGQNLPTLTGFAMTPPYLGLSPEEYFDKSLTMPAKAEPMPRAIPDRIAWLQKAGVTHLLSEQPLDAGWPAHLVWQGFDPLLNRAWARRDPLFLYALEGTRGRVALQNGTNAGAAEVTEYRANRVVVEVDLSADSELVLTDLDYPGWQVKVDGVTAAGKRVDGMFRAVDVPAGRHVVVWDYQPRALRIGAWISAITLAVLTALYVVWLRRERRVSGT